MIFYLSDTLIVQRQHRFKGFLYKLLNIAPHEVSRIFEAWSIRLCFQIGYVIGWTMLTALIVKEFGITMLPWMYMANALLMVAGSLIYSQILYAFENRTLILVSVVTALVLLILDATIFAQYIPAFIAVTLIVFSVFVSQLHIMLLAFIEELFTPSENERANPIIETSEPIGGIIAGIILATFAGVIHVTDFTYFWAFFVLGIIPVLLFFYKKRHKFMTLIHEDSETNSHHGGINRFQQGVTHLKAIPFVKFLAIVIFCQWMFVNILNYQYTKVVDASISQESLTESSHTEETAYNVITLPEKSPSAVTSSDANHDISGDIEHAQDGGNTSDHSESGDGAHHSHEDMLTHGLGTLHIIFSALMLVVQLFLSSRLVARLGIVHAMKFLPGVSLASMVTMFFNFQFFTVVAAKGLYEMFFVVNTNAYHNAYYAISERIREQIREFLEGIMRPLGVFSGTAILLLAQWMVPDAYINTFLTVSMMGVLALMLILLVKMREKYTLLAKKNLDLIGDHPEKHIAIEILSQQGHSESSEILTKNLIYKNESPRTKIKILRALAQIKDTNALPEILGCLEDEDERVQIEACRCLSAYKNLGNQFFHQVFAKFRVVGALTEIFVTTKSKALKGEIVQVFAILRHEDIVPFLLKMLENEDSSTRADMISIIRMFKDINAGYFIEKYLDDPHPMVKAQTIIALWQFKKYRLKLMIHLTSLLDDEEDAEKLEAGIYVLGETRSIQEIPRLLHYLKSSDMHIRTVAAVALAKLGKTEAIDVLLHALLEGDQKKGATVKHMIRNVETYYVKMLNSHLEFHIQAKMALDFGNRKHLVLDEVPMDKLRNLKYYYELIENDHDILKIEHMIKRKELASTKGDA